MVRRKYSMEFKEQLIHRLLEIDEVKRIAAEYEFGESQLRKWVRRIINDYALSEIAVTAENEVMIDGVKVEELLQSYLKEPRRHHGSFHFIPEHYPAQPGCYLMKNREGDVIYVGKAKNLRNRLGSYFQEYIDWKKTELLVGEICDIEVIIVNNEAESLFLENNLIKLYRPKYNRALMRENSGFAYIVLTHEEFPRLVLYRRKRGKKAQQGLAVDERCFGPYLNAQLLLDITIEEFKIRTCHPFPKQVCLSYHLKRCSGICEALVTPEEYAEAVKGAARFLAYKPEEQILEMEIKMMECAERLEFEKAQKLKKRIASLRVLLEKQIVEREVTHDQDVIYFGEANVLVTNIEQGMIRGMQFYDLQDSANDAIAFRKFLVQQYSKNSPRELIVNILPEAEKVQEILSELNQYQIKITIPKRGVKADLLKLCAENYNYRLYRNREQM